ncbi:MAG: CDP-diacylglycerol--glycerol-3-phosphate 3-phosphatidyltransferase [Clostridia bacterium]|nr:CDP-diacylglycerol--glycerol-3-phosphate 3-phosphatidyltransferase [Bacillota bacterium]MBO2520504.1 CDP-diacylglycerol--glycerol-3-phosphate 3-phosphatidyltransferase [Bacillota bacterium]
MTLATLITLSRIFLIPVFMALVLTRTGEMWAVAVFIVAALTDGLDGYVARARKEITKFGQLLDPIADKLLVSSALIALVELGTISSWVVMIILGREFAVSGLRMVVATEGVVLPAFFLGKLKTFTQIVAIVALLLDVPGAPVLLWIAVGITIVSGIDYFFKAQKHLW